MRISFPVLFFLCVVFSSDIFSKVDQFIGLVREFLPRGAFFAMNCHGGKGRCTTVSVMFDIIMNAHKGVSLHSILARNKMLHDYDLLAEPDEEFKRLFAANRFAVIELFYDYCSKADPLTNGTTFSQAIIN